MDKEIVVVENTMCEFIYLCVFLLFLEVAIPVCC